MLLFILGLIIGCLIDRIWKVRKHEQLDKKLNFIDHYHWGLISVLGYIFTDMELLLGIGTAFIIQEIYQKEMFAYGHPYFKKVTYIGIGLTVLAILSWYVTEFILA